MNSNKALLALVIGMGVVILVGLVVLGVGLAERAQDPSVRFLAGAESAAKSLAGGGDLTVWIPAGSTVISVERDGDYLMLHVVDEDDRSTVLFVDPRDGRVVKRIALTPRL